jgi:hypothetical protein
MSWRSLFTLLATQNAVSLTNARGTAANGKGRTQAIPAAAEPEPEAAPAPPVRKAGPVMGRQEWWIAGAVTCWLAGAGSIMLIAVLWAWGVADRTGTAPEAVHWIGPDFTATPATGALVLAAAAGAAASFIHSTSQFAARAGHRTFEPSYLAWYLLRPLNAALLAMVTVVLIRSGLVTIGTTQDGSGASVLAFTAGALAGLYTDRVMQLLRARLGAGDPSRPASTTPAATGAKGKDR